MSNFSDAHEIELPPRFIRRTLKDVIEMTARHKGDGERLRQNATSLSAAEWVEDMAWLYDQHNSQAITDEQFGILQQRFRARHFEIWGDYSHTPD